MTDQTTDAPLDLDGIEAQLRRTVAALEAERDRNVQARKDLSARNKQIDTELAKAKRMLPRTRKTGDTPLETGV